MSNRNPHPGSWTHPLHVGYLVVGLVFLGIAGSWALREAGVVDLVEDRWILPLTLVVAGLVGLVAAAMKALSRPETQPDSSPYDESLVPQGDEGDIR